MDNITLRDGFLGQKMIAFPKSVVNRAKENLITKNFYISDLGYYPKANHHYRLRKKGSNQYIFIYCTKGRGEITLDDKITELVPNQFFIIPKNVKHEYRANEDDPWSIYWLHFDGLLAESLYEKCTFSISNYQDIPFSSERIEMFEKIFTLFNSNYKEQQMEFANILGLNFISSFIYNDFEEGISSTPNDTLIDSVKEFLLQNLDKNFKLDEIASKFNRSPSYLHTQFKNKTGYPIMTFFSLKKIQKACEYLNYTDLSTKEISFKMGFADPLYFSRIFKNYMGKSPKIYKQSLHK